MQKNASIIQRVSKIVRKAADETVNNSDTLQNDDELLFPVGANQVWAFELFIKWQSGATPDIKFKWSVPSGTTMNWHTDEGNYDESTESTTRTTMPGRIVAAMNTITGIVVVGSTPGNVVLQWAQNTQDASDTKVLTNSVIVATKLA